MTTQIDRDQINLNRIVYHSWDIMLDGEFIDRAMYPNTLSEHQIITGLLQRGYSHRIKLVGPY